jgi:hypothetical protein
MAQAQSLVEDLSSRTPDSLRNSCGLSRLRDRMSSEEAEALDRAIELIHLDTNSGKAKVYSAQWLTSVLNKHGHAISASTVSRHLSKRCSCE